MKTSPSRSLICAVAALAGAAGPALAEQTTANPNASAQTKNLLNWLSDLPARGNTNRVVTGQFVSPAYGRPEVGFATPQDAYNGLVEALKTSSGQYVGLVGFDFCNRTYKGGTSAQNLPVYSTWNTLAKSYADKGGIVSLTWHAPNPFTQGNAWDNAVPAGGITTLLTPGTTENLRYMAWLDEIAAGLQWFEDRNVTVLWRPFHESSGSWFWWGAPGTGNVSYANFRALWQHMYNYFTTTKGLNNLVWFYSPSTSGSGAATSGYPGAAYVDIIGQDRYSDTAPGATDAGYNALRTAAPGKIWMFGEIGEASDGTETALDTTIVNTGHKNTWTQSIGYMFWMKIPNQDFSIIGNQNSSQLLNDAVSLNRDELPGRIVDNGETSTLSYSSGWTLSSDTLYFADTKAVSNSVGSTISYAFTGTQFDIYGRTLDTGGRFDVLIDGVYQTTVDTYLATGGAYKVKLYSKTGLSNQQHTATLRVAQKNAASGGAWVGFDYITSKQ